ncbi:secreted protein [Legionella nautarum]|uniref:Secreted protein n=1 Tax=Legionella nautarum TaxID=45070 RepID=A0A0W0WWS1_9GAMM|nr:protease inhibitor I42 family protein [Legionella nautarum]KTD36782.1 secreted protein [Legionella nautarum]
MRMFFAGLLLVLMEISQAATADNMTINVTTTQSNFLISLASNPTTGYRWIVTGYDKSLLHLMSSKYIPPQSKLMGAGGQMQFIFELMPDASFPASTNIYLKYAQPWEPKKGTSKTVTVNFQSTNN